MGDATWSNELALHVVELKTSAPAPSLGGLAGRFQRHVQRANTLLRTRNALLLPSGMHPFMDPTVSVPVAPALTRSTTRSTASRLPRARVANLQSSHLNLALRGRRGPDDEFDASTPPSACFLPIMPRAIGGPPLWAPAGPDTRSGDVPNERGPRPRSPLRHLSPPTPAARGADPGRSTATCAARPRRRKRATSGSTHGGCPVPRGTIEVRVLDAQSAPGPISRSSPRWPRPAARPRTRPLAALREAPIDMLEPILLATIRGRRALIADDICASAVARALSAGELWDDLISARSRLIPGRAMSFFRLSSSAAGAWHGGLVDRRQRERTILSVTLSIAACLDGGRLFGA